MKTFLFIAGLLAGITLGAIAGVRVEASTEALQVSRITGAPYFQVLYRPLFLNQMAIESKQDQEDDEVEMRAGESVNG